MARTRVSARADLSGGLAPAPALISLVVLAVNAMDRQLSPSSPPTCVPTSVSRFRRSACRPPSSPWEWPSPVSRPASCSRAARGVPSCWPGSLYVPAAFAGYLLGALADRFGWTAGALVQISVFCLIGAALCLTVRRPALTDAPG